MNRNIQVAVGDIRDADVDLLILKYAMANYGADLAVASRLGNDKFAVPEGAHRLVQTQNAIAASEVLIFGVGPLWRFEYSEIERFAMQGVVEAKQLRPGTRRIGMTIHGPGYGLDELAAVSSLVRGIEAGLSTTAWASVEIVIIEQDLARADRIRNYLESTSVASENIQSDAAPQFDRMTAEQINTSSRLFSALPFKNQFLDHWELAIQPAAHANGLIIERLDHVTFTGDVVTEIKSRIERSKGVVALLDEHNPNVFLEVGYAWGMGRPTILALAEGADAPFDVRGQRILRYNRIGDLKLKLQSEVSALMAEGVI